MIRILTLLFSVWIFVGCSSGTATPAEKESLDIELQIQGATQGKVILVGIFGDQQFTADTASMDSEGNARFRRDDPLPTGLYYILLSDNTSFPVLIDNDQTMQLATTKEDINQTMVVTGNLSTSLLYENNRYEDEYQAKIQPINSQLSGMAEDNPQYAQLKKQQDDLREENRQHLQSVFDKYPDSFYTRFKKGAQNPVVREYKNADGTRDLATQVFHYRNEFWDNVDFSNDDLLHTPVIHNKLKRYFEELTIQHQDSIIASTIHLVNKIDKAPETFKFITNWIALKYEPGKTTLMDGEAVLVHIIRNYFTREKAFWADSMTVYGLQQRASEMEASLVGKKGPDVISTDPNGQRKSIYEINSPYIIVYLYNPTCEHCIEETPQLLNIYREWKSKGLEVFAIAVDTEDQEWKDFIRKNNMNWINVFDPTNRSIYAKYYVDNTPEIYVLDPDRKIIAKNLHPGQVVTVLEKDISGRK